MKIHYWDITKELYVELPGAGGPSITIRNGEFIFEGEDIPYGGTFFSKTILLYDLCALIELYKEQIGP